MSKKPTRTSKPVRVSPLIAMYVPSLLPGAVSTRNATSEPLVSKTVFGVTLNRYRHRCEIVYADGRTVAAEGLWGLLFKMLRGASK